MSVATVVIDEMNESDLAALAYRLRPFLNHADEGCCGLETDRWLTTAEAAAYVGLSVPALQRRALANEVPSHQEAPGCKRFYRRSELDEWREGRSR